MKWKEESWYHEQEGTTKRRYFLIGFYCGFFVAILLYFLLAVN